MELVLISALDPNRVIGVDGGLPWNIPEDLEHFKNTTSGHPIIMGRVTFEQMGGLLPNRTHIVMSRSEIDYPDEVKTAHSKEEAIEVAEEIGNDTVFVIGGGAIYEEFLPIADRMILSEINENYDGDTFFPEWKADNWEEKNREENNRFDIVEYEKQ